MTMKRLVPMAALAALPLLVPATVSADQNWPQWRGPHANGVSDAVELPMSWSATDNIVWSVPLPAWSGGTPVIWEDRIFVTSPSEAAAVPEAGPRRNPGGRELLLICLSKTTGAELWRHELTAGNRLFLKHNSSSPSPVTDGEHVWVITGTGVVTALDMQGRRVWQRDLQSDYGTFGMNFGYASSPLLHEGRLILQVLHGQLTDDPSYVVALEAATGAELWRQERTTDAIAESPDAYTTPALLRVADAAQVVVTGGDYVTGHDVATGVELWRAAGLNPGKRGNYRVVGSPVIAGDMIYAPTRKRPLLALRSGGVGDISITHLAWKWEGAGAPDVPTPVTDGKYFYMVDDKGLATCLDAATGGVIWGPERTATGTVSASPILGAGRMYITNEDGVTTVLAAGPEYEVLATNQLAGGYTLSSLAVAGNQLFLRTGKTLYCIGATDD